MNAVSKFEFADSPWNTLAIGAREKAFERDGKKIRLVEFSTGFVEPEWCEKSHFGYVCEGELEIYFNGESIRFRAGDGIFILAGKKHKARPISEKVLLFVVEEV